MHAYSSAEGAMMKMEPEILRGHIPAGHIPKPVVIADYVAWVESFLAHQTQIFFFKHILLTSHEQTYKEPASAPLTKLQ